MKIFGFKSVLAMLTFSVMSLFFQSLTQAQVNKQLLSDVTKSCQRDMSIDYFKRMGLGSNVRELDTSPSSETQKTCIRDRYIYGSVIKKLPWLPDSGEFLPSYPASVAFTNMIYLATFFYVESNYTERIEVQTIVECVASKEFYSRNCVWLRVFLSNSSFDTEKKAEKARFTYLKRTGLSLPIVCPKCVVAHKAAVTSEMVLERGFIKWFLSLDKPKRQDVVSFLTGEDWIFYVLNRESEEAVRAYENALKKIEQDAKEQRRRDLLGQ